MAKDGIIIWRSKEVEKKTARNMHAQLYVAATIVEKHVKRKFLQRTYGTGTGELFSSIKIKKSKFDGYIVGVFGRSTTKWEDSIGARAIFFEFGRAAPGHRSRATAAGKRERAANKVQPPRPFLRTGLQAARSEIRRKLGLTTRKV